MTPAPRLAAADDALAALGVPDAAGQAAFDALIATIDRAALDADLAALDVSNEPSPATRTAAAERKAAPERAPEPMPVVEEPATAPAPVAREEDLRPSNPALSVDLLFDDLGLSEPRAETAAPVAAAGPSLAELLEQPIPPEPREVAAAAPLPFDDGSDDEDEGPVQSDRTAIFDPRTIPAIAAAAARDANARRGGPAPATDEEKAALFGEPETAEPRGEPTGDFVFVDDGDFEVLDLEELADPDTSAAAGAAEAAPASEPAPPTEPPVSPSTPPPADAPEAGKKGFFRKIFGGK